MKAAVLGTNDYHALMQQVVKDSLQRQAGYVPGVMDELMPKPIVNRGCVLPLDDDYPLALDLMARWCEGRAWMGGSAALWRYERTKVDIGADVAWDYYDMDLYAHSIEAYKDLHEELSELGACQTVGKRNSKYENVRIGDTYYYETVNLVCPTPADKWEQPANVLDTFDLNICQVVLGAGWLYVMDPDGLTERRMVYHRNMKNPMTLLKRIVKYVHRGYRFDDSLLTSILQHPPVADCALVLSHLYNLRADYKKVFKSLLKSASEAVYWDNHVSIDWVEHDHDWEDEDEHEYDDDYSYS